MLPQVLYNDVKTAVNSQQLIAHKMGIFNDIISIDIDYTEDRRKLNYIEDNLYNKWHGEIFRGTLAVYIIYFPLSYEKNIVREVNILKTYLTIKIYLKRIDHISNPSYEESIFLRLNDFDSYYNQVSKGLGSGTYGKVFQVGNNLALKLLSSESATENQSYLLNSSFLREISILLRLNHINVLGIIDVVYVRSGTYPNIENFGMILPLADHNLYDYMARNSINLSIDEKDDIAYQILLGFSYIHSREIIHGDIKEENILVFQGKNGDLIPKISDFGLSVPINCDPIFKMKSLLYSAHFRPIEIYMKAEFDTSADIWAIGTLLYKIYVNNDLFLSPDISLKGKLEQEEAIVHNIFNILGNPLNQYSEFIRYPLAGKYVEYIKKSTSEYGILEVLLSNSGVSDPLIRIIRSCLSYDPKLRPHINDIINDTYFERSRLKYGKNQEITSCIQALNLRETYVKNYPDLWIKFDRRDEILKIIENFLRRSGVEISVFFQFVYIFDAAIDGYIDESNIMYYAMACLSIASSYKKNIVYVNKSLVQMYFAEMGINFKPELSSGLVHRILYNLNFDLLKYNWYDYLVTFIPVGSPTFNAKVSQLVDKMYTKDIYNFLPSILVNNLINL